MNIITDEEGEIKIILTCIWENACDPIFKWVPRLRRALEPLTLRPYSRSILPPSKSRGLESDSSSAGKSKQTKNEIN